VNKRKKEKKQIASLTIRRKVVDDDAGRTRQLQTNWTLLTATCLFFRDQSLRVLASCADGNAIRAGQNTIRKSILTDTDIFDFMCNILIRTAYELKMV